METHDCEHGTAAVSSSMPGHHTPSCPLLDLPSEVLKLIWDRLYDHRADSNRDQHALRLACRASMHATTPFISAWEVNLFSTAPSSEWEEELSHGLDMLASFPHGAAMTAMRWSFDGDGLTMRRWPPRSLFLPALLPSFFLLAGDMLARLQEIQLSSAAALGHGELSSCVDACPRLRRLRVYEAPLVGPAFQPLARLPALSSLLVEDVWLPHGSLCIGESLRHLSRLTQLQLSYDDIGVRGDSAQALRLEDVLPHVGALTSLRAMGLPLRAIGNTSGLRHLSNLRHLPSLSSFSLTFSDGFPLSGPEICGLASASHLTSLSLSGACLDTSAIELLASLPKLTDLTAASLHPDRDLSRLPCAWQHLSLASLTSVRQVALLPLAAVTSLYADSFDEEWLECPLSATDDGLLHASVTLLRRAAGTLARATPDVDADVGVRLVWDARPSTSQASRVLSSLAPLRQHLSFDLELDKRWDLCPEVVQQLGAHLPNLHNMLVKGVGSGWGSFAGFIAAVVAALPQMTMLGIESCSSELLRLPESGADREALVESASGRGRLAEQRLEVSVWRVDKEDVRWAAEYNKLVAEGSKGGVTFTFYSPASR